VLRLRSKLKRGYVATAALILSVLLLSLTLVTPAISTTADFSIFNSGWNGTSELAISTFKSGKFAPSFATRATGTDIDVVQLGFDQLALDPSESALVVIGPTRGFSGEEARIAGDFVRAGGILLLADDFGTGNQLLQGMGATSRISGSLVMDLAFDKKPEFSVCFDLRPDPLTKNVSSLLLNYPSSISVNASTTSVLAYTSIASWQDSNGNRERDAGERTGPFPMMVKEKLGNGTIVMLADPSVLINGMAKYLNNSALDENLVSEICTGRSSVFFDENHRDFFNPVAVTLNFSNSVSDQAKAVIIVLAFLLVLWIATDYVDMAVAFMVERAKNVYAMAVSILLGWTKRSPSTPVTPTEHLETELIARHPDWRPGVLHYVVKEHGRHAAAIKAVDEKNG